MDDAMPSARRRTGLASRAAAPRDRYRHVPGSGRRARTSTENDSDV